MMYLFYDFQTLFTYVKLDMVINGRNLFVDS
jgi:hypothetical protein